MVPVVFFFCKHKVIRALEQPLSLRHILRRKKKFRSGKFFRAMKVLTFLFRFPKISDSFALRERVSFILTFERGKNFFLKDVRAQL